MKWPTAPIIDELARRATPTREPRRWKDGHGHPMSLVDLAAVVGCSHAAVSNLIRRGEITTTTAEAWAARLGVEPTALWPGFDPSPPSIPCARPGCHRASNGQRGLCKPCREAQRRAAKVGHVDAFVQRYGDQWVVDVFRAGDADVALFDVKLASEAAAVEWARSTFGDRLIRCEVIR